MSDFVSHAWRALVDLGKGFRFSTIIMVSTIIFLFDIIRAGLNGRRLDKFDLVISSSLLLFFVWACLVLFLEWWGTL